MKISLIVLGSALGLGLLSGCSDSSSGTGVSDELCDFVLGCSNGDIYTCADSNGTWYEQNGSYICSNTFDSSCISAAGDQCNKTLSKNEDLLENLLRTKSELVEAIRDNAVLTTKLLAK